jgi:uncharacterized protein (TIGR04255 family)
MPDQQLETICYPSNFLKTVRFKIDYSPILLISKELAPAFQEEIRPDFPSLEVQQMNKLSATIEKDGVGKSETTQLNMYIFESADKSLKLTITESFLLIECSKYSTFENFKLIIDKIYRSFQKHYKPLNMSRIGLRYINSITFKDGNPFDWDNYISPVLTHAIKNYFGDGAEMARAINQVTINKGEYMLVFTSGIPNSFFPAKISQREFVLDYDCSTNHPSDETVISSLDLYHHEIQSLFEKSIMGGLRQLMEAK